MKFSFFKYMFFIIVVLLIFLSIYILYNNRNSKKLKIEDNIKQMNIKDEINIGIVGYDTINPILTNNRDIQYITKLIYNPLIDITQNFKTENKLAKEVSKINSTTYIIKLNENIKWHDNSKFTAKDVLFTINNLMLPEINSIYKENVEQIKKVEQIDDYTLKIILNEEIPFFEYKLCFPIICSSSYESKTLNSKTELPNGTGNYKIIKTNEHKIQLVACNNDIKLKKINIIIKKTTKDLYNAFIKKEIDYFFTDSILYETYLGTMGYNVLQIPNRQYDYLVLNNKNNLLSHKEIRKALNFAIDKNSINYTIYSNKYINCNYPLYYGSYLYNVNYENDYNINESKNIFIQNGWNYKDNKLINKNKQLKLRLLVNKDNEKRLLVAKKIKQQLENIGVTIELIEANTNLYKSYLKNKNYDIILAGNIVSNSPNLGTYFGMNNLSNYLNQEVTEILKDIKNISEESMLQEKYNKLQEIYSEEIPFISLYSNSLFIISNKELQGDLNCNWYNLFYNIDNWYKTEN